MRHSSFLPILGWLLALFVTGCAQDNTFTLRIVTTEASMPAGIRIQARAQHVYSNGRVVDVLPSLESWSATDTSVATVALREDGTVEVQGVKPGSTFIRCTSGGLTATKNITVTHAVLRSISISPASPSVPVGLGQSLTAHGSYSDGTTRDISNSVTWTSSDTEVATVSHDGLATGRGMGRATLTAHLEGFTGSASLEVTAASILAVAVTPSTASIPAGMAQRYSVSATLSDGTTRDVTASATWTSDDTAVATMDATGEARGLAIGGPVTLTASMGSVSASSQLTVTTAVLTAIHISPETASIPAGRTQPFTANGTYSDGTSRDITRDVTWSTGDASVATITPDGLATGASAGGPLTLTAESGDLGGTARLTITPAVLVGIAVTPATASLPMGETQQFTATGTYSDQSTGDLTHDVTWTSSDTSSATVTASGLASGVAIGSATIKATHDDVSGEAALSVTAPACATPDAVCGETCVHLMTDPNNCGACGNVCGSGQGCANAICVNSGNLGISLAWDRTGDGDLYVVTPTGKSINYRNRGPNEGTDYGQLDRDDAGTGPENIYWASGVTPPSGTYHVCSHPYSFRPVLSSSTPVTFTATIRVPGQPTLTLTRTLTSGADTTCAPGSATYLGSFSYP